MSGNSQKHLADEETNSNRLGCIYKYNDLMLVLAILMLRLFFLL